MLLKTNRLTNANRLTNGFVIFRLNARREEMKMERRCMDGWFVLGSHTRCLDTCNDTISLPFVFRSLHTDGIFVTSDCSPSRLQD